VFKLAATGTVIKPFESFIWDASASSTSSIISVDGTVTELDKSIDIDSNDPLIAIRYYNLQGVEVQQPQENGIYLIKKIYASQKTETLKIFYNKQKK
jgi:hypothetical protein